MATYQDSRYNIALPSGSGGAITLIKTWTSSQIHRDKQVKITKNLL